jgi:hypothetical protein
MLIKAHCSKPKVKVLSLFWRLPEIRFETGEKRCLNYNSCGFRIEKFAGIAEIGTYKCNCAGVALLKRITCGLTASAIMLLGTGFVFHTSTASMLSGGMVKNEIHSRLQSQKQNMHG